MPKNKPTNFEHNPKIYRLALYGASGSGKTLLLASLAMDRINYHPNYTCTRVSLGQLMAEDESSKSDEKATPNKRHSKLQQGKEILDRAIDALREGRMPEATPSNHPDMLFEYDFGTGERNYRIELMDYAGELVHSTLSANDKAVRLRQELKKRDALLVLAPAPWPEDDYKALDPDLRSLQETFRLLCGERGETALQIPVAMVFTKWDRRSSLEYRTPENEFRELDEFLHQDPPPPHKALYNTLRSAVADPANFKAFPLSALGECRKIDLGQGQWAVQPETFKPLRAFGLEDPFIWAAERRDAMDLAAYKAAIAAKKLTRFSGLIPWPWSLTALEKQGRDLSRSFPIVDPNRAPAEQMWTQVRTVRNQQGIAFAITMFFSLLLGEFIWDSIRYQQVKHTIADPQANGPVVQSAESWLLSYTESSFLRHRLAKLLLLRTTNAEASIDRLRSGREELYWAGVSNASDLEKKTRAEHYLSAFPNGSHRREAIEVIAQYAKDQDWNEFVRLYTDVLNEGKTVEAASMLKARGNDPQIKDLKHSFEPAAIQFLGTAINQALTKGQIEDAYALQRQIGQWPIDLNVLTDAGRRKEDELLRAIKTTHDRQLYETVRDYRTPSALSAYLEQAPLGTMKETVRRYQQWLDTMKSKLPLSLSVTSIIWGSETGHDDGIDLTVRLNDETAITITDLESKPSTTSRLNREGYPFKAKLDDNMTLDVALKEKGLFGDSDWGRSTRKVLVKELNGLRMKIRTDELNNEVTFGLTGIKDQPDLPTWKED